MERRLSCHGGGKALCGVKAARTHQRASLGLWLTISSDHISLGSKHSARCQNLFLALRPARHTVPGPATVTQAETLMPCSARYAYPLPLVLPHFAWKPIKALGFRQRECRECSDITLNDVGCWRIQRLSTQSAGEPIWLMARTRPLKVPAEALQRSRAGTRRPRTRRSNPCPRPWQKGLCPRPPAHREPIPSPWPPGTCSDTVPRHSSASSRTPYRCTSRTAAGSAGGG